MCIVRYHTCFKLCINFVTPNMAHLTTEKVTLETLQFLSAFSFSVWILWHNEMHVSILTCRKGLKKCSCTWCRWLVKCMKVSFIEISKWSPVNSKCLKRFSPAAKYIESSLQIVPEFCSLSVHNLQSQGYTFYICAIGGGLSDFQSRYSAWWVQGTEPVQDFVSTVTDASHLFKRAALSSIWSTDPSKGYN